jgi:hypothetical protein
MTENFSDQRIVINITTKMSVTVGGGIIAEYHARGEVA